jgi:hypothetical protein
MLARSDFYVHHGNHALNQNQGLIAIGCVLHRADWIDRAEQRLNTLLPHSIDEQGVANERAVFYEYYDYRNYTSARERLVRCGRKPPSAFARVERMPRFMAAATRPDGRFESIGDSDLIGAPRLAGTEVEFSATRGAHGRKPSSTWRAYAAGYAFGRSGWGETRPVTDETFYSLRYGPPVAYHGHEDGTSLTFYGYGSSLVLDPGKFTYNSNPWREYFRGRTAHNLVVASGLRSAKDARTRMAGSDHGADFDYYSVQQQPYVGVTVTRRMLFVKSLGAVVVDDDVRSSSSRAFRQLWHLAPDARPLVDGSTTFTRRARGNVSIRQLIGGATTRVVRGATDPIQGWVSYVYGHKTRAPVVESARRGANVRWITLLVAWPDARPGIQVSSLRAYASGFSATIRAGAHTENVRVSGGSASAKPAA